MVQFFTFIWAVCRKVAKDYVTYLYQLVQCNGSVHVHVGIYVLLFK